MKILFNKHRIISYRYGYKLQKQISNNRWISQSFHLNLEQACIELLNIRILTETTRNIIDATNSAYAQLGTARLIQKINAIKDEILKGINNAEF